MDPVSNIYKGGFFKNRHRLEWRAPIVCQAIAKVFKLKTGTPSTIIDVGCAIGEYVKWFNENGYLAWGIEGSNASQEFWLTPQISVTDIREPLPDAVNKYHYNLAMSLEVAEHIEPEYTETYLENLTRLSETILITAAPPGQKGHGHVNCQEKGWWEAEMKNLWFKRNRNLEQLFVQELEPIKHRKEVNVYAKNCMIFQLYENTGR